MKLAIAFLIPQFNVFPFNSLLCPVLVVQCTSLAVLYILTLDNFDRTEGLIVQFNGCVHIGNFPSYYFCLLDNPRHQAILVSHRSPRTVFFDYG